MEREKFEESWKKAFDKAEVSPSDNVWTNIELDLEKAKGGHLKRRLMFYQKLAAASVVFAMAIGGVGLYFANNAQRSADNVALQAPVKTERPLPSSEESDASRNNDRITEPSVTQNTPQSANSGPSTPQNPVSSNTNIQSGAQQDISKNSSEDQPKDLSGLLANIEENGSLHELPLTIDDKNLPPFYQPRKIDLTIPKKTEEIDPVVAMLARLEQREKEVSGEKKNKEVDINRNENLWTSIGFAAGSFNTVHSSVSSTTRNYSMMALNATTVDEETKASGYSYSMGVNVGTKLAERWVFQGGVNYLTHSSNYTAYNAVAVSTSFLTFKPASTNEWVRGDAQELNEKIVYTAPYSINNSLRYLSIPMQAGYLLVDKTFGLQLNAGVATDLFLQNSLKAEGDNLDNTTQSGGADSPYRSVNLSGLFSTELSYRFSEHYRVTLNPGIRYPFNTIYKSELGVQASPLTFDVGLRFRYIFH